MWLCFPNHPEPKPHCYMPWAVNLTVIRTTQSWKSALYLLRSTGTPLRNQMGGSIVVVQRSGLLVTRRMTMYGAHRLTLEQFPGLLCPWKLQQNETHILNLQELAGQSTIFFRCGTKQIQVRVLEDLGSLPPECTTLESKVSFSCISQCT